MTRRSKRDERRRDLDVPVAVQLRGLDGTAVGTEYAINLSMSGVCLQSRTPFSQGSELAIEFELPVEGPPFSGRVQVMWCTQEERTHGLLYYEVGLRFCEIGEADTARLWTFVRGAAESEDDATEGSAESPDFGHSS